jgi:hypothetical protein
MLCVQVLLALSSPKAGMIPAFEYLASVLGRAADDDLLASCYASGAARVLLELSRDSVQNRLVNLSQVTGWSLPEVAETMLRQDQTIG